MSSTGSAAQPDALCLQELKLEDKAFPHEELAQAGYQAAFLGQKTYNGVAILSRAAPQEVSRNIPGFEDEQNASSPQRSATCGSCGYFPNGQAVGSDKFAYKLRWLEASPPGFARK